MQNVAKHAQASKVTVRLGLSDGVVSLEIRDNGQGFRVPGRLSELVRNGHLGVIGMAERAETIGGQLENRVVTWCRCRTSGHGTYTVPRGGNAGGRIGGNEMSAIRVVLADDHPVVRSGIRTLLDGADDIQVVGEASDGAEALQLVEELEPDILLPWTWSCQWYRV